MKSVSDQINMTVEDPKIAGFIDGNRVINTGKITVIESPAIDRIR